MPISSTKTFLSRMAFNPEVKDTDGAGVLDEQDGWASEPRLPVGQYVTIDLGPCSSSSPCLVNNNGQAVFQAPPTQGANGQTVPGAWQFWSNGATVPISSPDDPVGGDILGVTGLSDAGLVCGVYTDTETITVNGRGEGLL